VVEHLLNDPKFEGSNPAAERERKQLKVTVIIRLTKGLFTRPISGCVFALS
jgi:hypothetical protein